MIKAGNGAWWINLPNRLKHAHINWTKWMQYIGVFPTLSLNQQAFFFFKKNNYIVDE